MLSAGSCSGIAFTGDSKTVGDWAGPWLLGRPGFVIYAPDGGGAPDMRAT